MSTPNFLQIKPNGINLPSNTGTVVTSPGDLAYDSTANKVAVWATAADFVVQEANTATLVNKTISGASNTLSNISNASLSSMANNTVKANKSGSSASPSDVALGSLSEVTSSVLTISGANTLIGSTSIQVSQSTTTTSGYLSSIDWNTFNNKQPAGSYIKADGTVPFTASQSLGGNKLTNVADPTSPQDAATKNYVDAGLAALNPADSVYAATAGSNIVGTYLNGVAGIGATLTTTATGTFTVDGVTPPLGSRILIKDQTSGFQNGVYSITTLGSLGVSTVFTRTLDYDTPADINGAGLIPVINGTVNALSSWQQIATITTVGTDSLTFQEFTANPSLYLLKANNLSDVASKATAFNNISPNTTKGDFTVNTGSTNVRQPIGTDNQVLVADSTQTNGLKWTTLQQGAKNYITFNNFENNSTTGWSLGTVGALTNNLPSGTPTFGSGASGNLSISTVNSGQLAGSFSLSYASSAATTQGDMLATQAYTLDIEDQAKVLGYRFYYKAQTGSANCNFSGTNSNSFAVAVWDVTNSSFIPVVGAFNLVQGTGVGLATGNFQTNSNTGSLRFIVYNANATSGAATLYFDDFFVGPQVTLTAPAMSDFQSYSLSIQATTTNPTKGTTTSDSAVWRRVGDSMELHYQYVQTAAGSAGSGTYLFPLPSGYSIDTTKVNVGTTPTNSVGQGKWSNVSGFQGLDSIFLSVVPYDSTHLALEINDVNSTNLSPTTLLLASGQGLGNTNVMFTFNAKVPIAGWSSNAVSSADSDTRVVAAIISGNPASASANAPLIYPTVTKDTNAAYNASTGQYTAPVTGFYQVSAAIACNSAAPPTMYAAVAGVRQSPSMGTSSTALSAPSGSVVVYANSGQTIDVRLDNATASVASTAINGLTIQRVSGPAVVQATESVNARVFGATTTIGTSDTTIIYPSVSFDTHNAYNTSTGTYLVPVSGKYRVTSFLAGPSTAQTLNNGLIATVYKNGSSYSVYSELLFSSTVTARANISGSALVQCNDGDSLVVKFASTNAAGAIDQTDSPHNWTTFERVGN